MEPAPSAPRRDYGDALAVVTVVGPADPGPARLLAALPPVRAGRPTRVVVVDAGAGHRPVEGTQTVAIGEDVGYPAGLERAVVGLDREVGWVLAVRPGAVPGPGVLDRLVAAAAEHPRAGALGPVAAAAGTPPLRLLLRPGAPWPTGPVPVAPGPVERLDGACLLLRRAALDSVGGVDPRYGPLADLDLAERLAGCGWLSVLVPGDLSAPQAPGDRRRDARRYLADRRPGARYAPLRAALRVCCG